MNGKAVYVSGPAFPIFRLAHKEARVRALAAVMEAPDNWLVRITYPSRTLEQNSFLHGIIDQIAKSNAKWAERTWSADEWKAILVSGFAQATKGEGDGPPLINGIEGEVVQIRESTASMSKARGAEFITYMLAFCDERGIKIKDRPNER